MIGWAAAVGVDKEEALYRFCGLPEIDLYKYFLKAIQIIPDKNQFVFEILKAVMDVITVPVDETAETKTSHSTKIKIRTLDEHVFDDDDRKFFAEVLEMRMLWKKNNKNNLNLVEIGKLKETPLREPVGQGDFRRKK